MSRGYDGFEPGELDRVGLPDFALVEAEMEEPDKCSLCLEGSDLSECPLTEEEVKQNCQKPQPEKKDACICGRGTPQSYEGYKEDCPVHGKGPQPEGKAWEELWDDIASSLQDTNANRVHYDILVERVKALLPALAAQEGYVKLAEDQILPYIVKRQPNGEHHVFGFDNEERKQLWQNGFRRVNPEDLSRFQSKGFRIQSPKKPKHDSKAKGVK